jgi:hypothetical protein
MYDTELYLQAFEPWPYVVSGQIQDAAVLLPDNKSSVHVERLGGPQKSCGCFGKGKTTLFCP